MTSGPILTFELAERRFAIPLENVSEVLHAVAVTPLPGAPAVVEGIIEIRGDLLPVLDLRPRLGASKRPVALMDRFIVTTAGGRTRVLWVDRVHALVDLPASGVEGAPDSILPAEFISGIVRLPDGLVLIHDVQLFLSSIEEAELEEAQRQLATAGQAG